MDKFKNYLVVGMLFTGIALVNIYCNWSLGTVGLNNSILTRILFGLVPFLLILGFSGIFIFKPKNISPEGFKKVMLFFASFLLFFLPKLFLSVFCFASNVVWLASVPFFNKNMLWLNINEVLLYSGIAVALFMFFAVLIGIVRGRFNFRVENVSIHSKKLPESFHGFKIVQISDLHIGSFIGNMKHVQRGVDLINKQNPDIILFTGDLITVHADEVINFLPVLKQLKAKYGMFSVTGNHSYSGKDYFHWNKVDSPEKNLEKIIEHHKEIGFDILMNENRTIHLNGDHITLLGIENWGHPPFPQEGDINKAHKNVKEDSFKILMSHDPSFFDAQIKDNYNIDLTLSGHTHGMQLGFKLGNYEWSPSKFKYPKWGGLYRENGKYLYVNRGFGHVIYSARVGIKPEITLIELNRE